MNLDWHSDAREQLERICREQERKIRELQAVIDHLIDLYKFNSSPKPLQAELDKLYELRLTKKT